MKRAGLAASSRGLVTKVSPTTLLTPPIATSSSATFFVSSRGANIACLLQNRSSPVNSRNYASAALPTEAQVARFQVHGRAEDVVKIEKEPLKPVKEKDVLIRMLAAPIHTHDLSSIEGVYPVRPPLPAIPGSEGVGEVLSVGSGVSGLAVGDWVVPAKLNFGTWRTHAVVPETDLLKVKKNLKPEYASVASVNPCTAYRLLEDFVKLQPGDVIIQNGANSQVGQAVMQMAHQRKIKTINIIRDRVDWGFTVEHLKGYGGYVVVPEDMTSSWQFKRLISDLPAPKLALNCTGGPTVTEMARVLAPDSTLVTYGGMSNKPIEVPTSLLLFKNIQLRGFWFARWLQEHSAEERAAMFNTVWDMLKAKQVRMWMERHDFATDFESALKRAKYEQKGRKLLLVMADDITDYL